MAGGSWAAHGRAVAVAVARNMMSMDFETVRVLVTAVLDAL